MCVICSVHSASTWHSCQQFMVIVIVQANRGIFCDDTAALSKFPEVPWWDPFWSRLVGSYRQCQSSPRAVARFQFSNQFLLLLLLLPCIDRQDGENWMVDGGDGPNNAKQCLAKPLAKDWLAHSSDADTRTGRSISTVNRLQAMMNQGASTGRWLTFGAMTWPSSPAIWCWESPEQIYSEEQPCSFHRSHLSTIIPTTMPLYQQIQSVFDDDRDIENRILPKLEGKEYDGICWNGHLLSKDPACWVKSLLSPKR